MPEFELETIDLVMIGVFTLAIIGIGFWVGRGKSDDEELLLGGRGMSWPFIGFSLIVANFSGTLYLGLAGDGYMHGISVWNYEWMATLVLLFFALFILPVYLHSRVSTVPELLERRYDVKSRKALSVFTVVTAMLIDSAGAMFAGALVLQLLFPGTPIMVHIVIIALAGGGYVMLGGLQAVMITDAIQGVILFAAATAIFIMVFAEFDFDWSVLPELAPEGGFTIAPPADDDVFPWPGLFTGALFLSFYVWVSNHVVVQKVLSAKNIQHGRWGALFAGLMQLPFLVLLIFPGILARGFLEDIPEADMVWPALVFEIMPAGLRGFVVAALMAAIISTLDSVLNGASSLVVNDFIKPHFDWSQRKLLVVSRLMIGVFMVIAALWAPVILTFEGIVQYFQAAFGYITMPIVVVVVGGIFWKRATAQAAFITFVVGGLVGLGGFFAVEFFELLEIQFLYATGMMVALSLLIFVAVTYMTDAPEPQDIKEVMFTRAKWDEESEETRGQPFYKNYRILTIGAAILTIAVVIPFI
jgi:solute:Na+ symporter, SSS family